MDYAQAVEYIENIPKFAKKNKPENTLELIRRLGHPERGMKVIHVAGTNGKGSVCAFLSSILTLAGNRTGLFISPHLVDLTERIRINQEEVSRETFTRAFCRVKREVDAMMADGFYHPAYFELLFATGLLVFEEAEVEYLVLETGLGGRLDATNLVEQPIVCVLTTISLDHMEYLGDTVAKIAGEKAGIIKEGVPVIYDGRNPESAEVIRDQADRMHAPTYRFDCSMCEIVGKTDKSIDFILDCRYDEGAGGVLRREIRTDGAEMPAADEYPEGMGVGSEGDACSVKTGAAWGTDEFLAQMGAGLEADVCLAETGPVSETDVCAADPGAGLRADGCLAGSGPGAGLDVHAAETGCTLYRKLRVTVPFPAEYQTVNSSLALMALRVIDPERMISDEAAVRGIREVVWEGRMETVLPGVVFDGAHNADGIHEFIRTVRDVQEGRRVSLLFSAVVEKEYEKMIQEICEGTSLACVTVTQIGGARVVPAETLAAVFRSYTEAPVVAEPDVEKAFAAALVRKGEDGVLFCAGSLYLIGELKAALGRRGELDVD